MSSIPRCIILAPILQASSGCSTRPLIAGDLSAVADAAVADTAVADAAVADSVVAILTRSSSAPSLRETSAYAVAAAACDAFMLASYYI